MSAYLGGGFPLAWISHRRGVHWGSDSEKIVL